MDPLSNLILYIELSAVFFSGNFQVIQLTGLVTLLGGYN